MSESLTLIDNNMMVSQNPGEKESPFRRIEFHPARKPFTAFTNGHGGDQGFRLETLNPNAANANAKGAEMVSGKKRDALEMENGVDPELGFRITFRRIGAGLENLGNTCFLNSVLQCLTYTEPLAAYLQSGKHQVTCRKSGFCALCAIQKHVSRALQLSGRSLAPKDLVSNLRCISRTFRNSRQEDAHEYMVNLLESMHKCCLPNGVPSESQSAYDRSLVHKIFGGRLRSQVKCMQCNYCSNKFDPFLDLSLEILRADTLYKAFANFTAKEQLDGGAKQYQCQQCKQKVKALKQLTIHKPPNVLTVHLKRFGSHMSGQKIDKKIQFGPTLDLKPFVTGPCDGDLKYTLYGVLVHAGWSTHSGHYYCFVRTSSGMWYSLDDSRVYQVSEKKVFEQKAYMLFYFKDRKNIPMKKTTDVHQKEKLVMNGTPNGPGAPREAKTNTNLSNGSPNCQKSPIMTTDVHQKDKIVMNGTPNGPGAPKEAQMKTGLSDGSLSGGLSSAAVGTERNGFGPVAPEKTQTNSNLLNTSSNGEKSSSTDAEVTQKKEASVPKSISEASKTKDHMKENGEGESSGGDGHAEKALGGKTNIMEQSDLPKVESSVENKEFDGKSHTIELLDVPKTEGSIVAEALGEKNHEKESSDLPKIDQAVGGKTRKKVKNHLKCKIVSMKFSGMSLLNQRTKKKHKRNKRVKNLGQENLVNEDPSTSAKTEPHKTVKPPVENGLKERVDKDDAVLATHDFNIDSAGSQPNLTESNHMENRSKSSSQKDSVHMLTTVMNDRTVPRWDEDEAAPSQTFRGKTRDLTIGYIGDDWDEEYDRGKRKKVRISKTEFDGKNPFQDIANERLKPHTGKQDVSKRPPMMKRKKNKHFRKSRPGNHPFRI